MAMSQDEIDQFWKTAMEAFEAKGGIQKMLKQAFDDIRREGGSDALNAMKERLMLAGAFALTIKCLELLQVSKLVNYSGSEEGLLEITEQVVIETMKARETALQQVVQDSGLLDTLRESLSLDTLKDILTETLKFLWFHARHNPRAILARDTFIATGLIIATLKAIKLVIELVGAHNLALANKEQLRSMAAAYIEYLAKISPSFALNQTDWLERLKKFSKSEAGLTSLVKDLQNFKNTL